MIRNIAAIIFNVSDLDNACDFYQNTLNLTLTYKNSSSGWAEFDLNGVKFSLKKNLSLDKQTDNKISSEISSRSNPLVCLYVENLERTVSNLKSKGVTFTGTAEIQSEFFGNTINLKDLDGNIINLFEKQN